MSAKLFVLYDERARSGDTDSAAVLATADDAREARSERATGVSNGYRYYAGSVWAEYEVQGKTLVNERLRLDLSPDRRDA